MCLCVKMGMEMGNLWFLRFCLFFVCIARRLSNATSQWHEIVRLIGREVVARDDGRGVGEGGGGGGQCRKN